MLVSYYKLMNWGILKVTSSTVSFPRFVTHADDFKLPVLSLIVIPFSLMFSLNEVIA
jgi:hypothetical protein